jgi:competence protein ComEC
VSETSDDLGGSAPSPGGLRWAPLFPLLLAASVGIVIDRYADPWGTATWVALALGAGAVALVATNRELAGNLAVAVAFGALGGGWHHFRWSDRAPDDLGASVAETPRPAWVRGVVREALGVRQDEPGRYGPMPGSGSAVPDASRTRFVVDLTALHDGRGWRPVSGRAMLIADGDHGDILGGEGIEAIGQLAAIAGPLNPGEFDYGRFLRSQGIDLRLTVEGADGLRRDPQGAGSSAGRILGRLRAWSRDRLVGRMDPKIEPLAAALLLGRREGVDPEVDDAFAQTGTTHLLAISGLHMQVLAGALLIAARAVGIPRRPAFLVVALATVAYAILVGPAPSVVRSTVMTSTFCLAAIAGRITRPANILALAALATLAVNPMYLFDVGCQLSFLAIAALAWLVPPACEAIRLMTGAIRDRALGPLSPLDEVERYYEPPWRKWIRANAARVVLGVVTSTVVWLAALPLVALRFHIVAPIGILLNIPLIPITSVALLLGGMGLGLSAVWGPLGIPASRAAGVLLDVTQRVVIWGVAQPWGYRFVAGPGWAWVLIFYSLLALAALAATLSLRDAQARARAPRVAREAPVVGRLRRQVPWWMLAAWSLGGWILAAVPAPPRTPEADILAVGHGLAVVIHSPGGQAMLYDCGRMGDPSVGRRIIAPALWSRPVADRRGHPQSRRPGPLQRLAGPARSIRSRDGPRPARIRRPLQSRRRAVDRRYPGARHPRADDRGARVVGARRRAALGPAPTRRLVSGGPRQRAQPRARRGARRPAPAPDRRPRAARTRRVVDAPEPRAPAGRHAGAAPRRPLRQPGLALQVGRAPGGRRQSTRPPHRLGRCPDSARTTECPDLEDVARWRGPTVLDGWRHSGDRFPGLGRSPGRAGRRLGRIDDRLELSMAPRPHRFRT